MPFKNNFVRSIAFSTRNTITGNQNNPHDSTLFAHTDHKIIKGTKVPVNHLQAYGQPLVMNGKNNSRPLRATPPSTAVIGKLNLDYATRSNTSCTIHDYEVTVKYAHSIMHVPVGRGLAKCYLSNFPLEKFRNSIFKLNQS